MTFLKTFLLRLNFIIILLLISCTTTPSLDKNESKFDNISFDVVQKKIIYKVNLPDNFILNLENWFSKNVKLNGFDGDLVFSIDKYEEQFSEIDNGKRIDILIDFSIVINKPSLSQKKIIQGKIQEHSTITGDFSLSEVDSMLSSTQLNSILRLSKDLASKI